MYNFKDHITEQKNTHMRHLEDSVLYGGVKGTREAIMSLISLRDMLGSKKSANISVKWDGAPAIFAGTDPTDGKFFVAKKGIFNKNPKIYKTDADVDADTSGDLATKLKIALKNFAGLGIKGVIQGDLLYTKSDLSVDTIDGDKYLTFHPNTIVYAVPHKSTMANEIRKSEIGVVWHTTYTGNSFESMKASYGVKVSALKNNVKVWSQDAMLRDLTNATLTKTETETINEYLSSIGQLFQATASSTLKELESNQPLAQHIEQFNNTFVRKGEIIGNSKAHTQKLIRWITTKYQSEANKRKSETGKKAQYIKLQGFLDFFSNKNQKGIENVFELQRLIVLTKLKLLTKLNSLSSLDTFVKTSKGYKVTGQEGYVAIDKIGKNALKIVDRLEFSYNNFSPSVLKGWDKAK
jgi:hypothetical protein